MTVVLESGELVSEDDERAKAWRRANNRPAEGPGERQQLLRRSSQEQGWEPDRVNHSHHSLLCCLSCGLWLPCWISACACGCPALDCWDPEPLGQMGGARAYQQPPGQVR